MWFFCLADSWSDCCWTGQSLLFIVTVFVLFSWCSDTVWRVYQPQLYGCRHALSSAGALGCQCVGAVGERQQWYSGWQVSEVMWFNPDCCLFVRVAPHCSKQHPCLTTHVTTHETGKPPSLLMCVSEHQHDIFRLELLTSVSNFGAFVPVTSYQIKFFLFSTSIIPCR